MARLEILEFPDPRLRTKAMPVAEVDDRIRKLCDDMLETMYDAKGIGLAATQVNVHERVVVMDLSEERDSPQFFINPEIEPYGELVDGEEGCLSVPGYYDAVQPGHLHSARMRSFGRQTVRRLPLAPQAHPSP